MENGKSEMTKRIFSPMLAGFRATLRSSGIKYRKSICKQPFRTMASLNYRDPIVLKAKEPSAGTVIFLHGLGDSGEGWEQGMAAIQRLLPNVKFILPNAPTRAITCNFGMKMPGWYDIFDIGSIDKGEDATGLEESRKYLSGLIEKEISAGTPSEKIVVGGFSQGGAMTYYTVYSSQTKLAGALVLSGYMPLSGQFEKRLTAANTDTPLFACHGDADPVVQFNKGKISYELAEKHGIKGSFNIYKGMAHSASMEELTDVAKWLKATLVEPKL